MKTISHNVINIIEKLCIFIMLLFHFQCAKKDDNFIMNQKDWIRLLSHPIGYFMVEDLRDPKESPECGGDAIGTLLGMNNNRPQYEKLEENQEVISSTPLRRLWYYSSPRKTIISITILNFIENPYNGCENEARVAISFCDGTYLSSSIIKLSIYHPYMYEPRINTKNLLAMYSYSYQQFNCSFQYSIKSETP